jgi:uncharacterized membrane protein
VLASALVGGLGFLSTRALPRETQIIISLDVFLLTFVTLVYVLMSTATAEQCAELAMKGRKLEKQSVVFATVLATFVSVAAIGVMLNSQRDHARWLKVLHLAASLIALLLGWISAQMIFGIQYMRIYYSNLKKGGREPTEPDLHFPGQSAPVLWDFMYYSFTVAMTYGTTDVSAFGTEIRRLTLLHAVYSFLFVATIIGFVVSVLTNVV